MFRCTFDSTVKRRTLGARNRARQTNTSQTAVWVCLPARKICHPAVGRRPASSSLSFGHCATESDYPTCWTRPDSSRHRRWRPRRYPRRVSTCRFCCVAGIPPPLCRFRSCLRSCSRSLLTCAGACACLSMVVFKRATVPSVAGQGTTARVPHRRSFVASSPETRLCLIKASLVNRSPGLLGMTR